MGSGGSFGCDGGCEVVGFEPGSFPFFFFLWRGIDWVRVSLVR